MESLTLLIRALWWRRGFSLALVVVAAVTIGSAALGPMYARAAGESTLVDRLRAAPPADSGLHFGSEQTPVGLGSLKLLAGFAPAPGSVPGFPTQIVGARLATSVSGGPQPGVENTNVVIRDGYCAHLVVVSGRCPSAPGEVMVSQRALTGGYAWSLGVTVTFAAISPPDPTDVNSTAEPLSARIVGSYRPKDTADPFWFGFKYFDAHTSSKDSPDTLDALFVDGSELDAVGTATLGDVSVDYPIDPTAIRLADVAALRGRIAALQQTYGGTIKVGSVGTPLILSTGLPGLFDAAHADERSVDIATLLVTLQLAVLAWLVLFQVMADAVEARGNEIALAKLRGLGPLPTVRFGLAEPVALVVVAIPIGVGGAALVVHELAGRALAAGTPVTAFTGPTALAVVAALLGAILAAGLAARRTLTRPVLDQWRRTTSTPKHSPLAPDLLLAVAAIVGLVLLRSREAHVGRPSPVALLGPALLVFAVALLGVRLLPPAARAFIPVTRASRRLAGFLAVRQVARRPAALRLAALLAVAVGLATFAIAGETVARANRVARAQAETGAPTVLSVQFESDHDPVLDTRAADPDGRWAMAAARWLPDGGQSLTGAVLGVDSGRFAAVAYPTAGTSVTGIASAIAGHSQPSIVLRGTRVSVQVRTDALTGSAPTLELDVRTPRTPFLQVPLSALQLGDAQYTGALPCAQSCLLNSITFSGPIDNQPVTGSVLISRLEVGDGTTLTPVDARFGVADAWRAGSTNPNATDAPTASADGLHDRFEMIGGPSSVLVYADSPARLPFVATPKAVVTGPSAPSDPSVQDAIGTSVGFRVVGQDGLLPFVLDNGVLGDLGYLRARLPAFDSSATWTVWLGRAAPQDAVARLERAGLIVQSQQTEAGRVRTLGRQGPALALLLLLATAIAGSVLAVGATAIAIAASGRRRAFELAALRVVGVPRGALLRACIAEQLILLGVAVLLGVPTGWIAARISMSAVPEFSDTTPVPLQYVPAAGWVLAFAGSFIVLLVLTAVVAGRTLVALAVPGRLREAEA